MTTEVLEHAKDCLRESATFDLLWTMVTEVVSPLRLDVRREKLIDELPLYPGINEAIADLLEVHS